MCFKVRVCVCMCVGVCVVCVCMHGKIGEEKSLSKGKKVRNLPMYGHPSLNIGLVSYISMTISHIKAILYIKKYRPVETTVIK